MSRFDLGTKVKITPKNFMQWFGQFYKAGLLNEQRRNCAVSMLSLASALAKLEAYLPAYTHPAQLRCYLHLNILKSPKMQTKATFFLEIDIFSKTEL